MTIKQNELLVSDQSISCPVCNEKHFTFIREAHDDRYGQPDIFQLVRCNQCGHQLTYPRIADSELGELYSRYYPRKYLDATELRREASLVLRTFTRLKRWWNGTGNQGQYNVLQGEIMLDVGCGSGVSLLEAKHLGANVYGVEADPNVRKTADELGLNVYIGNLHDDPFPGVRFDLIVLNQVIEHLPDPDESLRELSGRLTPNGRMVLVFPNTESLWRRFSGSRWINWHIPYHLHHFNRKNFEFMARRCGLKVVRSRTITPNVWTLLQLRANLYQPQLGQPSPIWAVADDAEPAQNGVCKANLLRTFLRVTILSIFGIINRVIDALGMGDSLMVELHQEDVQ